MLEIWVSGINLIVIYSNTYTISSMALLMNECYETSKQLQLSNFRYFFKQSEILCRFSLSSLSDDSCRQNIHWLILASELNSSSSEICFQSWDTDNVPCPSLDCRSDAECKPMNMNLRRRNTHPVFDYKHVNNGTNNGDWVEGVPRIFEEILQFSLTLVSMMQSLISMANVEMVIHIGIIHSDVVRYNEIVIVYISQKFDKCIYRMRETDIYINMIWVKERCHSSTKAQGSRRCGDVCSNELCFWATLCISLSFLLSLMFRENKDQTKWTVWRWLSSRSISLNVVTMKWVSFWKAIPIVSIVSWSYLHVYLIDIMWRRYQTLYPKATNLSIHSRRNMRVKAEFNASQILEKSSPALWNYSSKWVGSPFEFSKKNQWW